MIGGRCLNLFRWDLLLSKQVRRNFVVTVEISVGLLDRPDIQNYKYILLPTFNKINEMFIRLRRTLSCLISFILQVRHRRIPKFLKAFSSGTKNIMMLKSHTPMRFMQSSTLHSWHNWCHRMSTCLCKKSHEVFCTIDCDIR